MHRNVFSWKTNGERREPKKFDVLFKVDWRFWFTLVVSETQSSVPWEAEFTNRGAFGKGWQQEDIFRRCERVIPRICLLQQFHILWECIRNKNLKRMRPMAGTEWTMYSWMDVWVIIYCFLNVVLQLDLLVATVALHNCSTEEGLSYVSSSTCYRNNFTFYR